MKSVLNNNNGYILAFVLIISILIPVLFLSFIAISSNTTKQNEVVENTFQSQSIAEMGASYFQHAMTNEIKTQETLIIQNVITQRKADIQKNIIKNDAHYIGIAITDMQSNLDRIVNTLNKNIKIHQNTNNSFDINPTSGSGFFSVVGAGDKLRIAFTSTGHDELKQADIKGTMEVNFANILGSGTGGGGTPIFQNNTIPDPGTNLKTCPNEKKANFSNETCQIKGSVTYKNNDNLTFNNSVFRVDGALNVDNLNNGNDNSTLYITGSMTGDNLNNINNLKLHVGGALMINGNMNGQGISNSIIEVGGSAAIYGKMKITNSTIYIDYDANIEDVTLYNNAKICVNGPLTIGSIKNSSSGTIAIYAKSSNNPDVITNPAAFEAACTSGGSTATPGSLDYKTNYEYSY